MKGRWMLMSLSAAGLLLAIALTWVAARGPAAVLSAVTSTEGLRIIEGIAYGGDSRQRMDVYMPTAAPTSSDGHPVVVFFYGGSWQGGRREDYRFVARTLAQRGIVVVVPDYRLYPQVRYPEFLRDGAQAVSLVLQQASMWGGDKQRVFVMGHSAGAYNAAMLALDERWLHQAGSSTALLAGWVGLAGPYDFLPITNEDVKPVFFYPNSPPDSQPIVYVSPSSPPCFLGAALRDDLVNPHRNTMQLAHKLRDLGVEVQEKIYPRANHLSLIGAFAWPLRGLAPVLDDVSQFVLSTPARARRPRTEYASDTLASTVTP